MSFRSRVEKVVEDQEGTLKGLAGVLGVDYGTFLRQLNTEKMHIHTLYKMCEFLSVSADYLISDVEFTRTNQILLTIEDRMNELNKAMDKLNKSVSDRAMR